MEWFTEAFSQEPLILFILIAIIISIFGLAARRAHFKHIERMKKIDESFNPKETFHR